MAPLPPIPKGPLPAGQTTIISTNNGDLGIARPPPPPRPGPIPKETNRSDGILGRRLVGGENEQRVLRYFAEFRMSGTDGGEPGDAETINREIGESVGDEDIQAEDEDEEDEYKPRRRYAYTREHKLAAIDYHQTTWKKEKNGTFINISIRFAAKKLRISRKMLRHWIANKPSILKQKKGSYRSRQPWRQIQEEEMERELNKRFIEARSQGRKVTQKWVLRHARDIYGKLHPDRVVQRENGRNHCLGFRFSDGWFNGFKKRWHISLRSGTKRAQKTPEELLPVIQSWLQFNRRMTVILKGSDCGIPRDPSVPLVGRYKLSEIANMDQSPLPFELQKGRTYATKGSKTVTLKAARSGWEKRQCTLQIIVFADGIARCKPLLMFHGKPTSKDRRRIAEMRKYHPGVIVIFNEKAYANTSNLVTWVKRQYSVASAYPSSDREPRLLCLDAFAPHKNKGRKDPGKESQKAIEKRLAEEALQQGLREELAKLNVTTSIIPGGCTGYVQVLDVSVNKLIKQYIEEEEERWIDENIEQYKAGRYSVGDRRVLMTHWVAHAWEKVHKEHKDTIIRTFRQVGLSLNPDGSEDSELKIKDLPGIVVGDYNQPTIIPDDDDDIGDTIEVQKRGLLYTEQELEQRIAEQEENQGDVITDSGDDTEAGFEYDSGSDFDNDIDGDEQEDDYMMD
jgi:Tc5 transposase DNA-binding domain